MQEVQPDIGFLSAQEPGACNRVRPLSPADVVMQALARLEARRAWGRPQVLSSSHAIGAALGAYRKLMI